MAVISAKILEIIKRHKGEKVFAVHKSDEGVSLLVGKLTDIEGDKVVIRENKDNNLVGLSLNPSGKHQLLHLYNKLFIDLVNAKKTVDLSKKVSDRELQKEILKNLKKKLRQDLLFVFKGGEDLHVSRGKFKNMRIKDIVLSPGPFYNQDESLNYRSVFHIYSPDGTDLINV
jgi:hypothetical protein